MQIIPIIPNPESMEDLRVFLSTYRELSNALELLSSPHIMWFTHKNPYGCWICDLKQALRILIDTVTDCLYPSAPLDTA